MKIEILKAADMTDAAEGWRRSRNLGSEVSWEEVALVDVPVNEFPSVLLSFQDMTIFEREIFTSSRSHVMWARTSHVDDPLKFTVPPELGVDEGFLDQCRMEMRRGKEAGQSQDEWRVHLPVLSHTSWTSRMSFRDLVKMTRYFGYVKDHVLNPLLRTRLADVEFALWDVIDECTKNYKVNDAVLATYVMPKYLHEIYMPLRSVDKRETSGFLILWMTVPLWLRAQIVRHRTLIFADDFWRQVVLSPTVTNVTIGESIRMEIATNREVWRSIVSKRSCWLAQDSLSTGTDKWQEILDKFGWSPEMLPCHDGTCPYSKDASLRLTDADPGAPCPRYLTINGIDQAPYRDRIIAGLVSRHSYWKEQVR